MTQSKKQLLFIAVVVIFFVSAFLRFYALSHPSSQVFDEVYFPVFANDYLTGKEFYDSHPPLGKLFIATSIKLFGNNPLGWRFINAVTGTLLLAVVFGFTLDLTKRWYTALLALFLVAIEPMALVESRVGLINIYLAIFSLTGLWCFWRWWDKPKHSRRDLFLALLSFGAAIAVKWIGIGAFAAALVFLGVTHVVYPQKRVRLSYKDCVLLLIIPIIYIVSFIPDLLRGQDFVWWHKSSFNYHAGLTATHPYGAEWWTWPLMLRPIWLHFEKLTNGSITGILELGNSVTWIGGLAALLAFLIDGVIPKKMSNKKPLLPEQHYVYLYLILTYFALFLPWIFISRVKFIYHYFVPVLLLLIFFAVILEERVLRVKEWRWIGILVLVAAVAFFLYFLPLLTGMPVSESFYRQHLWLKSWI